MKLFDAVEQFNTDFWDCECSSSYIKSIDIQFCPICGAEQDEQPSSLVVEVNRHIAPALIEAMRLKHEH